MPLRSTLSVNFFWAKKYTTMGGRIASRHPACMRSMVSYRYLPETNFHMPSRRWDRATVTVLV